MTVAALRSKHPPDPGTDFLWPVQLLLGSGLSLGVDVKPIRPVWPEYLGEDEKMVTQDLSYKYSLLQPTLCLLAA